MNAKLSWITLLCGVTALVATAPSATQAAKVRIVLAGDSTVTDNAGWGGAFAKRLKDDVECVNLARSGRSSRSYIAEGWWRKCLDLRPDYLLIQFGHNDQPGKGPHRETDPQTSYRANMTRYVEEARAKGIQPVLVTSLARRTFGDDGRIQSTLTPYVEVVKQVAAEKNVPLIDLHARSIALFESLGPQKCQALSPREGDATHLNARGAELVAPLVADELRQVVPALAKSIASAGETTTVAAHGAGAFQSVQETLAADPDPLRQRLSQKSRAPGPGSRGESRDREPVRSIPHRLNPAQGAVACGGPPARRR